jgi:4-carboxymuconolactone decarboxylase
MAPDEELIYEFCTELLRNNSVSDATYARAVQRFGEQGMIEMVGVVGYYTFQSMVLNTARTPVPAESCAQALSQVSVVLNRDDSTLVSCFRYNKRSEDQKEMFSF